MNLEMVKEIIYEVAEKFFSKGTVIWAEQIITKPKMPYITLKVNGINKTFFPVTDDDGNRYYPCNTKLEINLYTKGKPMTIGEKVTGNYANTAMSDMMDFFKFLESDTMIDYLAGKGIDIQLIPPIRDLTELLNDSRYRYRSMAEATISYSETADGPYGVGGFVLPNNSGGGTEEMAITEEETFVTAEITETEGGQENDEE